jgi:allophanate hydrolase
MARFGVPASGPMDRVAHATAQAALGMPVHATAIEVSMGGLELACEQGDVTCCVAGGGFHLVHEGAVLESWCVRTLRQGDVLSIRAGRWGCWAYVAFSGELVCDTWAGRAATHSTSGLGGGMLKAGARIVVRNPTVAEQREGPLPLPDFARARPVARVVLGSQRDLFEPGSQAAFLGDTFAVTPAFDRMGMRLSGPKLTLRNALSIPSEPIVRGTIQVGGDGVASILMADHQTTGGYPKIANIVSSDVDGVSQLRAGDRVGFEAVDAAEAIRLVRLQAQARQQYLERIAEPRGTLLDRLMRENLVTGVVEASGQ